MDTDVANGASDPTASGTALLSRKGLFGKSGVLNQNLDQSIAVNQDSAKMEQPSVDDTEQPTAAFSVTVPEHSESERTAELTEESHKTIAANGSGDARQLKVASEKDATIEEQAVEGDDLHVTNESVNVKEYVAGGETSDAKCADEPDDTAANPPQPSSNDKASQEDGEPKLDIGQNSSKGEQVQCDEQAEDSNAHSGGHGDSKPPADMTAPLLSEESAPQEFWDGAVPEPSTGELTHEPSGGGSTSKLADEPGPPQISDDAPSPEPSGDVGKAEIVEEVFVKKIISMDTDDTVTITSAADDSINDSAVEQEQKLVDEAKDEVIEEEAGDSQEKHEQASVNSNKSEKEEEEDEEEQMPPTSDEVTREEDRNAAGEEKNDQQFDEMEADEPCSDETTVKDAGVEDTEDVEMSEQLEEAAEKKKMDENKDEESAEKGGEDGQVDEGNKRKKSMTKRITRMRKKTMTRMIARSKGEALLDELAYLLQRREELPEAKIHLRQQKQRRHAARPLRQARRTTSKRRHEEEDKADDEEKPEISPKRRKSVDATKEETTKNTRQRSSRLYVEETKKTPVPSTPTGRKTKKEAADAEDESEADEDKKEVKKRGKSAKVVAKNESTPKSSARRGRTRKEELSTDKEVKKDVDSEVKTPQRRRNSTPGGASLKATKSAKNAKSEKATEEGNDDHDPYDIETEMERHPVPLKNIQMEVQSFGEVKYAKLGSGKYERTEKTAEQRVVNLADMKPRSKQRRSLAELTPGRKKIMATGSSTAPQPSRRSKKSVLENNDADSEETGDEQMSADDTESRTPKRRGKAAPSQHNSAAGSGRKRKAAAETPAVVPKKMHVEAPQLSPDELLAVDHPQDEHAAYEPGARVYAMFDGLFYPAVVVSRDGLGRFKVHFIEDNLVKDVPPAGVIPLRALDEGKECFYAESSEADRLAVKVIKSPDGKSASAWFEADFELEQLDDDGEPTGTKLKAVWTQLSLSKDDWKDYINKKSREATDVIADNIESTEDRQLRRSKTTTTPRHEPAPRGSRSTPKGTKDSSTPSSTTSGRGGRSKKVHPVATAKEEQTEESAESTAEERGEQIFTGKLFILTSANRPNTDTGFKKKFMTDFISSNGGLVVDDMKEVDEHPEMERFLVSDTHYRTHKYLAALVRAMPCVSHEWIYTCLNEKKLVDYKSFLLPSGVSILDDREYPLPTKRGLLLRNKKVMVHSNVIPPSKKSMSFEQIWVPMVPQLGGEVVEEMPGDDGQLDILLTDHSATASIVEQARKLGSIVVSSEWLIQGIIMDRLPDVGAHQKFLHNGGVCT
ncbi:hypothetical protein Q1695_010651 [Nippostrongylus brasiliensis]|nr:hypothetical protein Q1695_010651 [Nippostrongylus brasiliensis]